MADIKNENSLQTAEPVIYKTENTVPETATTVNKIENSVYEAESKPRRYTKTLIFSPEEYKQLNAIYEARVDSGLTTDWNNFLRQLCDYTLNQLWKERVFAVPVNTPVVFKNTFKPLD